ncbi:MAG: component of SufBCD complex [Paracoccaceae bacterium]|nr:MAG: component of SufBCD complex [Paracoccaceae bacterium]
MDWTKTVFEVIDMRSFSNLWFWIAVAVLWSSASHWVLGVPFDMVARARRHGGTAAEDLDTLVRINARRILYIVRVSGLWLTAIIAFMLTALMIMGFWYRQEFAQAVLLLAGPMTVVGLLSFRTALRIEAEAASGPALWRRLTLHRMAVQGVGVVAIFATALWGMYQNLNIGAY